MKYSYVTWLLCFLMFSAAVANAQTDLIPGYYIKNDGDTVHGLIRMRSSARNSQKCIFKLNKKARKQIITPEDIRSYRFDNSLYYVSREIRVNGKPTKVFLEWAVKGKLNLYMYCRRGDQNRYFAEKADSGFFELVNTTKMTLDTLGIPDLRENKEYIGTLAALLNDCPSMVPEIYKSRFEPKYLIQLSTDYQNKVCPDEKCLVFKRPDRKLIVELGPVIDVYYSNLHWPARSQTWDEIARSQFKFYPYPEMAIGISSRVSNIEFLSPRIFLQADLVYQHTVYGNSSYGTIYSFDQDRLTLMLGYTFTMAKVRPSIALGPVYHYRMNEKSYGKNLTVPGYGSIYVVFPDFESNNQFGLFGRAGLTYAITDWINLSLTAQFERESGFLGYSNDVSYTADFSWHMGVSFRL